MDSYRLTMPCTVSTLRRLTFTRPVIPSDRISDRSGAQKGAQGHITASGPATAAG
jgi:hypothetical protein